MELGASAQAGHVSMGEITGKHIPCLGLVVQYGKAADCVSIPGHIKPVLARLYLINRGVCPACKRVCFLGHCRDVEYVSSRK